MKKNIIVYIIILFTFSFLKILAYEIHFVNPTNGQVFACGSDGTAAINLMWYSSGQKSGYYYFIKLVTHNNTYEDRNNNPIQQ